jgi:hypothetical protein
MHSRLSDSSRIFGALFILVSLTLLTEANRAWATEAGERVAVVGKKAITEKEISCRVQIEKAYGNEGATEEAALISVINDAIEHEIATIYGVTITRDEIGSFKRYVDENTKAPEILEKVKLAFGDDQASYERIYLAPKIMNWKLRSFYSRNPEFHRRARLLIEKAYGLVSSGKRFQDAANECGLKSSTFDIGGQGEAVAKELKGYLAQNNNSAKDPLVPILERLSPDEIYRNIVEDDSAYRIIRLSGRSGNTFAVEEITARKQPFDEWQKDEAAKLKIEIVDLDLKNKIKSRYPDIWWIKQSLKYTQQH